jgi:hypothetical protein
MNELIVDDNRITGVHVHNAFIYRTTNHLLDIRLFDKVCPMDSIGLPICTHVCYVVATHINANILFEERLECGECSKCVIN